ncbi:CHAT domain-containing protein [Xylaria sp. FL0064]|nr:CHAT domain-containing protein [Xylaria sp. FL0064]
MNEVQSTGQSNNAQISVDDLIEKVKELNAEYKRCATLEICVLATQLAEQALEHAPPGHNKRWDILADIGWWRHRLFINHSKEISDIDKAINGAQEALDLAPDEDSRIWRMCQLATYKCERTLWTHSVGDINDAVSLYEEAERLLKPDNPILLGAVLRELASCLDRRNDLTSSMADLDRAIETYERDQHVSPGNKKSLNGLALCLRKRGTVLLSIADVDRAVRILDNLVSSYPQNALYLTELGMTLNQRYTLDADPNDLEAAVDRGREAALLSESSDTSVQLHALSCLSSSLGQRFDQWGDPEDLDNACELASAIVDATIPDPDLAMRLHNYAMRLLNRFDTWEDPDDLRIAEKCLNDALKLESNSAGNSETFGWAAYNILVSLSIVNSRRFEITRDLQDLDSSLQYLSKAHTRPEYDIWLGGRLVRDLLTRHLRYGSIEDLDFAINHLRANFDLPATDVMKLGYWSLLSDCYSQRGGRARTWSQSIEDANSAIEVMEMVVKKTPRHFRRRAGFLAGLAEKLRFRSDIYGDQGLRNVKDLEDAAEYALEACSCSHENSTISRVALLVLGRCYLERSFLTSGVPALEFVDQAIATLEKAGGIGFDTAKIPENSEPAQNISPYAQIRMHPGLREEVFMSLARAYYARTGFPAIRSPAQVTEDFQKAEKLFQSCLASSEVPVMQRIMAGMWLAGIRVEMSRLSETVQAEQQVLALLPHLTLRSLSRYDQISLLQNLVGLSRATTRHALESNTSPEEALKFLEQGRGLMARVSIESRADVSRLDDAQAEAFNSARDSVRRYEKCIPSYSDGDPFTPMITLLLESHKRYLANQELQRIITTIQSDPKTKHFLDSPPLEEVRDVLGDDTIVVINAADGCDAFIIDNKRNTVRVLNLPLLTWDDLEAWTARSKAARPLVDVSMLSWLWNVVVHPILDYLGFEKDVAPDPRPPRIIWIATGPLCHLPLHAAGVYDGVSRTTMDYVMSSYTPSLRALVDSKKAKSVDSVEAKKALLVSMGHSPGLRPLPFAKKEVQKLSIVCSSMSLETVCLDESTRATVLAQIPGCAIFHFAGHAMSDPIQPEASGLILYDGHLTVSDLLDQGIRTNNAPFLGFLSACLTGAIDADDLTDEGVHLISAFQQIGFRHVVGTLWQVDDEVCEKVASAVYRELAEHGMSDEVLYRGLHNATMALRDDWIKNQMSKENESGTEEESRIASRSVQISEARARLVIAGHRHAKARSTGPKIGGRLVKADWVPFMHYGA